MVFDCTKMLRSVLFSFLCVFISFESAFGLSKEDSRIVTLEGLGKVKGFKYWDGEYHEFYGIPYATAPTGRNRYKAPLPPTPWEETLIAKDATLMCQQVYYTGEPEDDDEEKFFVGQPDCLAAHVLVPKVATDKNLVPVVVYIHSGAFVGGSGYMSKYYKVAQQDVIVVTLNYRLGALGFACLGTENIPGNAALKDLVAGLKWVNKHIKSFGGDPNKVTLAGFSVGATLAELIALTKETDGLFQRLMLDSGSALMPFAIIRNPIDTAMNIAKASGFDDSETIEDLEEFLLEGDLKPIQTNSIHLFLKNSTFGFGPCIENPQLPGALLTESPYDILKSGDYAKFDFFAGFGNMEGISRTSQFEKWIDMMNDNFEDFLPADLVFADVKERDNFIKEIMHKYFKGDEVSHDTLQGFIDYFSDSMFKYGLMRSAKLHAARNPIYLYEFTYVGKLNTKHQYMDRITGASHRDASAYVLDFYDWTRNYTDLDHRDRMVFMWTDYVKIGNPTYYESPLLKIKWQKYTNEQSNYLDIGYELVNKQNFFEDSYKFWDKTYQKNYWNPTPVNPSAYKPTVTQTKPVKSAPTSSGDQKPVPSINEKETPESATAVPSKDEKVAGKPVVPKDEKIVVKPIEVSNDDKVVSSKPPSVKDEKMPPKAAAAAKSEVPQK